MIGEVRLVRGALRCGAIALVPVSGIAFLARGGGGAIAAAIALGIVLANAGLAAGISAAAAKIGPTGPAMVAMPSFMLRMAAVFASLTALRHRSFVDAPTFALIFGFGVLAVIVIEAVQWKRTPWIALTYQESR